MKKALSMLLVLVMLIGMMPMQVFATEGTQETEAVEVVTEPTEAPEEETTAPAEETEPSEEEEKTEPSGEEEEKDSSEPAEPEEELEIIHEHDYEAVVTDPTCTEQGYTTYTCECGDSYVDDYVDATGHSYANGICTVCGESDPDYAKPVWGTWVAFGTSITEDKDYMRPNATNIKGTYIPYLSELMGVDAPDANYSIGGAAFSTHLLMYIHYAKYQKNGLTYNGYTHTAIKNADLITIEGGVNDFYGSVPLGKVGDTVPYSKADPISVNPNSTNNFGGTTDGTFAGCIYAAITELRKVAPDATIVFITDNAGTGSCAATKANALGHYLHDYNDMMTAVAESMGCYVIDAGRTAGFEENLKTYLSDHIHQSEAGGEAYANAIWRGLCAIQNGEKPESGHTHRYTERLTTPTCTEQGYTTYSCICGDSYVADYVAVAGEHSYDDGVCIWCGRSKLGADWLKPEFAEGDYSMVVLPDTQMLVQYWPEAYYDQTQWIAENADALNIKAALHMGDMINTNNDTQWTVCKTGIDTIRDAGVSVMPMRGNHDDSAWFNRYFDYTTYGPGQSGFGGSYHADKLDHAYWFLTAGGREYMILSLGWAPSWDVLDWAKEIVNRYSDKSVILACHAYMNKDGTLLDSGDQHAVSSVLKGYPDGDDVWSTFKDCGNVVLAMGGHIHDDDLITYVDKNGAGRDVTSLLVDRQDDDIEYRYGMVAVLTFHENSEKVDINWYSTRYDAFYKAENQFSITVPDVCKHTYTSEKTEGTCTEGISTRYTCTICGYSYVDAVSDPLNHHYENNICSMCGLVCVDLTSQFTDWTVGGPVVFKDGTAYGEDGYISGTNLNLKRSDYIRVEGYETIEFTVCARVGNNPGGGYAFYTDKGLEYFISEGSSTRNGNGASSEGTVIHKIEVPENAKYIRLTYWADSTSYATAVPFSFVGYTFQTHIHTYKSTVTAPTCTEKGYTTYTCECGDSYVDAVSDPLNHHYENNICSMCGLVCVDLTSQFTDWTVGGPVVFKDGTAYGEDGYISGTNLNLKRSDYIRVEGYETIEFTVCARVGNNPGGGYAFYTDKGLEYFISEGSSTRNGNGASSEGTVVHKIEVPENAKYIRLTYWADSTSYATAVPFSFVGYRKQNGPVITQQAESVEQEVGKKFAITVKAEGEGLTYQWYYKDSGMKSFGVSSNKTASYAYTMMAYMHDRQVYCVITDANGNSVQTETATITRPPQALRIVEQPQDARVNMGEKFSISPKVEGEGLTYQWYVKESGAKAFKVSSVKGSAYALTMQQYMIGRQVYCVITDKYGNTVTTDVATISLPPVELKILEQPIDVYASKGEKFSISPKVQGDGLTYQWYYKESYMKDFKPSSNKTSAYAYSMQTYMNERSVYCVITDQYGNQVVTEVVTIHLEK